MEKELLPWRELKRQRVYDCLLEKLRQPLCIVQAPAGIGKRSAVRGFLEETGMPYLWYFLMEDEYGTERMWRQMSQVEENETEELQEFAGGYFPQNSKERQALIKRLRQKIKRDIVIVIEDGYQESHSEEFRALLEDIVNAKVEKLHVILICSRMPELRSGNDSLSRHNVIGENTLNFTENEIGAYFKINGVDLSSKEQRAIYQYTEGWATAIGLILQDYVQIGRLRGYLSSWTYMKEQVFDKLSETEQEITMKLSPLKKFTIGEAVFVTQMQECRAELKKVALETNFIEYSMEDGTFRIHHLLKLIAEKEYTERGNSVEEILKRSAMWKEEHGEQVAAIHNYNKIGEIEEAFRVLETGNALKIYKQAPDIFADMCANLTPDKKILHIKAYLTYIYYLEVYDNRQSARRDFEETEKYFYEQGLDKLPENRRLAGEMCIVRSLLNIDKVELMAKYIREAYELLEGKPSEIFDAQFIVHYMIPDLYSIHYNRFGNLQNCIENMKEYSKYYLPLINAKDSGWEWLAEGEYYYQMGEVPKAAKIGEMAFQKACFRKETCAIISTAYLKMKCSIYLGEYTELINILKVMGEMAENVEKKDNINVLYDLVNGYIRQCIGENGVAEWLKNYEIISYNNYFKAVCAGTITYGDILIEEGKYVQLIAVAEDMVKYQERSSGCYLQIKGEIYLAIAKYHLLGEEAGQKEMEKILKEAQKDNVIGLFMENAEELLPILKLVRDKAINPEYLKSLIVHCQHYQTGLNRIRNKGEGDEELSLLTGREYEVLQLVKNGYKNGEIGKTLNIATVTVEKTLSNIYRKLDVKGRTEAVKKLDKIL